MSTLNETLIRDVVAEVLGKLGGTSTVTSQPAKTAQDPCPRQGAEACSCGAKSASSSTPVGLRGRFGVFQDATEACAAAQEAYLLLQTKGVAALWRKIEEIVKGLAEKNAEPWGKIEFDETRIGRLEFTRSPSCRSSSWCRVWTGCGRTHAAATMWYHPGRIYAVRRGGSR